MQRYNEIHAPLRKHHKVSVLWCTLKLKNFLLVLGITKTLFDEYTMRQHTIIYKYGKGTRELKFKRELKHFSLEKQWRQTKIASRQS